MTTLSGGPRPDDFSDDDVLTAALFKEATQFWVADDVPSDGEGKDGDVVFVLKEEELGGNCPECPEPELPGIGGWAEITDVSGSPKRYAYPEGGTDWVAFEWTAAGTFTTNGDKCLIEALLVSGGGGGFTDIASAASVHEGIIHVPADSNPIDVTPGAAGVWDSNQMPIGRPSGIGDFISTGISQGVVKNPPPFTLGGAFQQLNAKDYQGVPTSWSGAVVSAPHASSITGNPETYAAAYPSSGTATLTPSTTGYGDTKPTKASAGNGQPGVVIVRVPAAQAEKVDPGSWVTRSNYFAVVENGVVTETYTEHHYGNGTITPLPQTDLISCDANVTEGYSYENGEFVAPVPEIPAAQQEILDKINELQQDLEELTK